MNTDVECCVCLTPCDDVVVLPCGHGCCREGWLGYVESHVREGRVVIGCVGLGCDHTLTEEHIRDFAGASPELIKKYEYFVNMRRLESDPMVRWCINPRCGRPVHGYTTPRPKSSSGLMYLVHQILRGAAGVVGCAVYGVATALTLRRHEGVISVSPLADSPFISWAGNGAEVILFAIFAAASSAGMYRALKANKVWEGSLVLRVSRCEDCGTESCFDCKSALHEGSSCADQIETDVRKWVHDDTTMRAPCHGCRSIIELRDGCNHMTCVRCGYQFCMLCGESIAGKVRHHYSKGGCTRYNGSMSDAWKRECWEFGSAPVKFTRNQVNQLSLPCVVVAGALMLNYLWQGLHRYGLLLCSPVTLAITSTLCSAATLGLVPAHDRSLVRVLCPQVCSVGLALIRCLLFYSSMLCAALSSEWTCLVLFTILFRLALLAWCVWATFKLALLPHTLGTATWNSVVGPSVLRPFLDLHLVANLYTAAFYGRHSFYDSLYASVLCLGLVFLGAIAFFSQTQFGRPRDADDAQRPQYAALWDVYRRVILLGTAVFVIVFFDVTWSLRCLSYIACSAAALLTPTSLNKIPYHTALLGYVQRWQREGKKGPAKKVGVVVCAGVLVELAFLDGTRDGFFLTMLAHVLVLNIAPLAMLSVKQTVVSWWQQRRQRALVSRVQPVE